MLKWSAFPLKHATGNTMSEFIAENRGADAITRPNWSAVFSVAFCVACLIIVEFLPVSLLTPMAQDLGISEGVAGQSVTVTAFVAMFASVFITQNPPSASPRQARPIKSKLNELAKETSKQESVSKTANKITT